MTDTMTLIARDADGGFMSVHTYTASEMVELFTSVELARISRGLIATTKHGTRWIDAKIAAQKAGL